MGNNFLSSFEFNKKGIIKNNTKALMKLLMPVRTKDA